MIPNHQMDQKHAEVFVDFFKLIQAACHQIAVGHGWWDNKDADLIEAVAPTVSDSVNAKLKDLASRLRERNDGEILALMHSELSEALEGHRHGNGPSEHIPEFSAIEEELADVVIRVMDYSQRRGFKTADAIIAKMHFNHSRPYRHGNKAC